MDNLRNRSLGELFTELSRDVSVLVRKEIELARLEMSRIANTLARRATFIAIGAVLAVAGLLSLIATLTLAGIALGLSPLASSAIVTVLMIVIGGVLVMQGTSALRTETLVPTETIQTLKETGADPPLAGRGRAQRVRSRHMGMPEPTRDKAQDVPDVTAPPPGETPRADIHELPRNEAFRHGVEDVRDEATPVRGPSTGQAPAGC